MSIKQYLKDSIPRPILSLLLPPYHLARRWFAILRTRVRCMRFSSYPAPVRVELGPGMMQPPPGWLSVDMSPTANFYCDLRDPLPFPSSSIDEIYSSHVLEHLSLPQLRRLLADCVRVLKPGGIFSAAVPNGGMFVHSYTDAALREKLLTWIAASPDCELGTPMDVVNHMAHLGGEHQFLFDEENLVALLQISGFTNVRLRDFDPERDVPQRREESLYAFAQCPAKTVE
jgi:predicted SAM-dependent methyltransferase